MLRVFFLDVAYYFKYRLNISAVINRICCVFSGLLIAYYLLICIFSVLGALDDFSLHQDLGFCDSFNHHLVENNFYEVLWILVPVVIQFCMYLFLYYSAEDAKHLPIGIICVAVAALFFMCMFIHARSFDFAQFPPFTAEGDLRRNYLRFSRTLMLQSVVNCFSYLLHIKDICSAQ